jgi:hypothetical protein
MSEYAGRFAGPYSHRTIEGGIGHFSRRRLPKRSRMPSSRSVG